jgi:hypothetical protein
MAGPVGVRLNNKFPAKKSDLTILFNYNNSIFFVQTTSYLWFIGSESSYIQNKKYGLWAAYNMFSMLSIHLYSLQGRAMTGQISVLETFIQLNS